MRTPTPWVLPVLPTTRADLLAAGVTPRMLRTRVASGDLIAVRRGVFLSAERWPDDLAERHLMVARAEQARVPAAVMSHETAALAWGLPNPGLAEWAEAHVSLLVPVGVREPRESGVLRHRRQLPQSQVARTLDRALITSPARTAVDLAAGQDLPEALALLDAAARIIIAGMVGVEARRRDYANSRLSGAALALLQEAAAARRCTSVRPAIALVDPRRESVAESLSAAHLEVAGLPRPQFQAEIRLPRGRVFTDCYWPDSRLVGEVDGAVKYTDARAYVLEKEREQALRDAGFRIVRWLAKEIMFTPAEVIARIARAL